MNYHLNIIAPSGYCGLDKFNLACTNWSKLGFSITNPQIGSRKYLRFGGNDEQRRQDISLDNIELNQQAINIIMPVRGGYGLSRIIDKVNWNVIADTIIKYKLKVIGHSDFTLFNLALLSLTNTISFAGPMFSVDFGVEQLNPFMFENFNAAVNNKNLSYQIKSLNDLNSTIQGILWGGNLAMICSIIGSKYLPKLNGLLFIEDINESPYRIERMLYQLYHAGILQTQKAIIFGNFSEYKLTDYDNGYNFNHVLEYWQNCLAKYNIPIFYDLAFGHCPQKATIPIGAIAVINSKNYYASLDITNYYQY